jgi:hypothetical protein
MKRLRTLALAAAAVGMIAGCDKAVSPPAATDTVKPTLASIALSKDSLLLPDSTAISFRAEDDVRLSWVGVRSNAFSDSVLVNAPTMDYRLSIKPAQPGAVTLTPFARDTAGNLLTGDTKTFTSYALPPALSIAISNAASTLPHTVTETIRVTDRVCLDSLVADFAGARVHRALQGTDTTLTLTHQYTAPGQHAQRFTAYNCFAKSTAAHDTATTLTRANTAPTVRITLADSVMNEGAAIQATLTYNDADNGDAPGALKHIIVSRDALAKPDTVTVADASGTVNRSYTLSAKGVQRLRATAVDQLNTSSAPDSAAVRVDGKPVVNVALSPNEAHYPDSLTATITVQDETTNPSCRVSFDGGLYTAVNKIARLPTRNPLAATQFKAQATCSDARGQESTATSNEITVHKSYFIRFSVVRADNNAPYDTAVTIDGKRYATTNGAGTAYVRSSANVRVPGLDRVALWKNSELVAETNVNDTTMVLTSAADTTDIQLRVLPVTLNGLVDTLLLVSRGHPDSVKTNGGVPSSADINTSSGGIQVAYTADSTQFATSAPPSAALRDTIAYITTTFLNDLQVFAPRKVFGVFPSSGSFAYAVHYRLRNNIIFPFALPLPNTPPCARGPTFAGCNITTSDGKYTDNTFDIPTRQRVALVYALHPLFFRNTFADQGGEPQHLGLLVTESGAPTEYAQRLVGVQSSFSIGYPFKQ